MKIQSLLSPAWIKNKIQMKLFGSDVKRMIALNKIPDVDTSLVRIKNLGIVPKLIFDVGAYHGEFINSALQIWPGCEIVAFEALPDKIELLRQKFQGKKVKLIETMIGDIDSDDVKFYADENASSALYSEEVNTKKKVLSRRMMKLDTYISNNNISAPDFLQIDTLSFEYQILKGIETNLPFIDAILLQLNFIEVFHEVKLANEVIEYLSRFGFVIYDICDIHRRPLDNALWQMDVLFVKQDSYLRKNKRWG